MIITQILPKDIPNFKKGWSISFPPGAKDIYFKLENDLTKHEVWEILDKNKEYPRGIMSIEGMRQYNYFRVTYYPEEITEQSIISFVNKIDFKE